MSDSDLEAISADGSDGDKQKAKQEQASQQEDVKNVMLSQVLDQQARARLNTLKVSKPEKAAMVENMVIRMAQTGQVRDKLDDEQFKSILESIIAKMPQSKSTVKYDRRRAAIETDDDEEYDC